MVEGARARVDHYHSSGQDAQHRERLADDRYRGTIEYTVCKETEHLESFIARYDELLASSVVNTDFLSEEMYARRIAALHTALSEAERSFGKFAGQSENIERQWQRGQMSEQEYVDKIREVSFREQRLKTRLEMGGLGMSYDDLGAVSDQSGHILEDALSDDDGEMRQKIAKTLRSMPRDQAVSALEQAVEQGIISEETARYLIREFVRSR